MKSVGGLLQLQLTRRINAEIWTTWWLARKGNSSFRRIKNRNGNLHDLQVGHQYVHDMTARML